MDTAVCSGMNEEIGGPGTREMVTVGVGAGTVATIPEACSAMIL